MNKIQIRITQAPTVGTTYHFRHEGVRYRGTCASVERSIITKLVGKIERRTYVATFVDCTPA